MSESVPRPAVIYAAKSTEDTHGSIPTQLDDCRRMAEREGWTVAAEYSDENVSAYHGSRGDGLAAAKAHAEQIAPCVLIVQHTDRLARGDAVEGQHLIEVVLWARKAGVTIRSLQDDSTPDNLVLAVVMGERNHEDSKRKGAATKAGIRRRAARGRFVGGRPPYGYTPEGKPDPVTAAIVRRIFTDYSQGVGQRGIARALNAEGVPGPAGGAWHQSRITAILRSPAYIGRLPVTGDDGELLTGDDGEPGLPGAHEPLIGRELWQTARRVRTAAHRRRGGRHADGAHLLTRGLLRCGECGAAMNPRKVRPGVNRESYVCSGRVADPASCSQPSIQRVLVDGPLLTKLLDRFVDLQGMQQRIAERMSSAVSLAQEAAAKRERERGDAEAVLARVRSDYQRGAIEAEDWNEQRPGLVEAVEAASAAAERSRAHAEAAAAAPVGDPEGELLEALARLKAAVATGVDAAPNLPALRNTLDDLFESIVLIRSDKPPWDALSRAAGRGVLDQVGEAPGLESEGKSYWLCLSFRQSAMDPSELLEPLPVEIPSPMGQETPVEWFGQYPPGFLARYCWW